MHVPSFLLVLAGSLVALPGPGRCCNLPEHELTIMFAELERSGAQITTLSFSKIRSDLTNWWDNSHNGSSGCYTAVTAGNVDCSAASWPGIRAWRAIIVSYKSRLGVWLQWFIGWRRCSHTEGALTLIHLAVVRKWRNDKAENFTASLSDDHLFWDDLILIQTIPALIWEAAKL